MLPKGLFSVTFAEGGFISGSMIAKGKKKGALVNCALALSHISLAKASHVTTPNRKGAAKCISTMHLGRELEICVGQH